MKEPEPAAAVTAGDATDWKGTLHKVIPEKGLAVESWNYNSNQFFQLNITGSEGKPLSLNIFYLLTPGSVSLVKKTGFNRIEAQLHNSCMFFTAGNTPVTFKVYCENSFRALLLKIDNDWITKELKTPGASAEDLTTKLIISQKLQANYSANEYLLANRLYEHIAGNHPDNMFVISRTLLLLSDFFERSLNNSETATPGIPVEYYKKMQQVESIIISSIKRKLPTLEMIASETAMSASGLKRYFPKVFGSNIHEYYIAAKMETAKRMLLEKNLSVTEVSEFLGYDNPKYFINNFKKHFSFLPADVLKSNHNIFSKQKNINEF
ncbi:MAG: AraC family transcriptional regulator [Bacteroidota bacterium]